jgi:hypothetical protein
MPVLCELLTVILENVPFIIDYEDCRHLKSSFLIAHPARSFVRTARLSGMEGFV